MCEVLVRIVDKTNPNAALDVLCFKAGDVIAVMPDGHQWGSAEIQKQEWRIISIPDMTVEEAEILIIPETGDPLIMPIRRRLNFVNISGMPANIRNKFLGTRSGTGIDYTLSRSTVLNYISTKTPINDPAALP